jgi:hypothetical protein
VPGGDFQDEAAATTEVGDVGFHAWSGEGMAADVQFWLDNPGLAFGWLLLGDESETGSAKRFDSRESPDAMNRPSLLVTFTPPGTPVRPATWGGLKRRYRLSPRGDD